MPATGGTTADFDAAVKEFEKRFAAAKIRAVLQEAGSFGLASMKSDTPVRTGFLRDSEGISLNSDFEMEMFATAEYAGYVNGGTIHQRANNFFDRGSATTAIRILENIQKL